MKINESPDHFYVGDKRVGYQRSDAVSFVIFKEGFLIYSTGGVAEKYAASENSGHIALAEAWMLKTKKDKGLELNETEEELWNFYKDHFKTYGKMGPTSERFANEFVSGQRGYYDFYSSEMLKGRLWTGQGLEAPDAEMPEEEEESYEGALTDKVISFWGVRSPEDLKPQLSIVLKLIELIGEKAEDFEFELGDRFYPYSSVVKGAKSTVDFNKKYNVGSSVYTYTDFENLRTTMHTGGPVQGKRAKEKLCRIMTSEFIEKNPELRGFIPPDCSETEEDDKVAYTRAKRMGWRDFTKPEVERGLAPEKELLRRKYGGATAKQQIKSFLQGAGPEPITSTTIKPGQTAGIRGRTLGGFRGKTQKEIDAAWDDFMRKREQTSPDKINFKEWFFFLENFFFEKLSLLNEDPNEVPRNPITGRPKVKALDSFAITFILFKDYFVYSPTAKGAYHDDLCRWLAFKVLTISYPGGKEHLEKFEKANPWTGGAREVGKMGPGTINTIRKVTDELDWTDGRSSLLRVNPEVILGRLWLDHKVVSFWNYWPYVTKASDRIMKFVSIFDDPSNFEYDVRNMAATHEDIVQKKPVPSSRDIII